MVSTDFCGKHFLAESKKSNSVEVVGLFRTFAQLEAKSESWLNKYESVDLHMDKLECGNNRKLVIS